MPLSITPWKWGKRWVYSITYDEALSDLHRFAVPLHEELGVPGHVEAVAGHLGTVRQIGQSSYNEMCYAISYFYPPLPTGSFGDFCTN